MKKIPDLRSDMIFWFADGLDRLSNRIKTKIERLDHQITMLENRRGS
jgi:hypothetical protein